MYSCNITNSQKSGVIEKFGDWDIGTEYKILENVYSCNQGRSNILTVFETNLNLKNQKYFMNIYSDSFISCTLLLQLVQCFLEILHGRTIRHMNSPNPWNFKLYSIHETNNNENNQVMLTTHFKYNTEYLNYKLRYKNFNPNLDNIITDLHYNHQYFFTMFPVSYRWQESEYVHEAHAVACGLIKQDSTIEIICFIKMFHLLFTVERKKT